MSKLIHLDLDGKLLVRETTYKIEHHLESLGHDPKRSPISETGAIVDDQLGASCMLPSGTRVTINGNGAIINDKLHIELSSRRRTGGRLVTETISINIRPATDSLADNLLAQGFPLGLTPSNGNPI
jgi:hypothetical protein